MLSLGVSHIARDSADLHEEVGMPELPVCTSTRQAVVFLLDNCTRIDNPDYGLRVVPVSKQEASLLKSSGRDERWIDVASMRLEAF